MSGDDFLHTTVLPKLDGVKPSNGSYVALCPAHDDTSPSLSVSAGTTQPVVFHCHTGCSTDAILAALDLSVVDVCNPREPQTGDEWTPAGPASHVYDYRDENGTLLFQVLRVPQPGGKKTFRQRVPDLTAKSGWKWKLGDTRRVPYRLPQILQAAYDGEVIYVCEGEKDAESLVALGLCATCNPGGANAWRPEFTEHFTGAAVKIIADADDPGREHARKLRESLASVASEVTVLEPAFGKDVSDHLAAGRDLAELVITHEPNAAQSVQVREFYDFLSVVDPPEDWVLPGLLERGDRLIWTGHEGVGKSLFTRQVVVAAAAGLHPFGGDNPTRPQRVLFVDLENSNRQGRRHFRYLDSVARFKAGNTVGVRPGHLYVVHRPEGIDVTSERDYAWLMEAVNAYKPDLLTVGPWYKLHAQDGNEEVAARGVARALDQIRTSVGCALIIEGHAGHAKDGDARSVRPIGSSLILRWPEMGMGIRVPHPDNPHIVQVRRWRGDRDERHWPSYLQWGPRNGKDWSWIPCTEHGEQDMGAN